MQILPSLQCVEAVKLCFQNYCKFTGRARRSEFWYFYMTLFIITIFFDIIAFNMNMMSQDSRGFNPFTPILLIFVIIFLICAIPSIAVTVRRLHDTGRSGVYYFVILIPLVGIFLLLYFCALDSEERTNEYGPSPKYILPQNYGTANTPLVADPNMAGVTLNVYTQPVNAQGVIYVQSNMQPPQCIQPGYGPQVSPYGQPVPMQPPTYATPTYTGPPPQ